MNVVIVGSGISGLLSAYYLLKKGYEVQILEGASRFASKASAANASQLSYSYVNPLGSPAVFKMLPAILANKSAGLRVADWGFDTFGFGTKFLWQSVSWNFLKNRARLLEISFLSRQLYREILQENNIEFKNYSQGKLQIFHNKSLLKNAKIFSKYLKENFSVEQEILDSVQTKYFLQNFNLDNDFNGAVFSEVDETASCYDFCADLLALLQKNSKFSIKYNIKIKGFVQKGTKIEAIIGKGGQEYKAEKFLLCTGSYTNELLDDLAIKVPIFPVKGYTLEYDIKPQIKYAVTDHKNKIVIVPFGDKTLASGTFSLDKTNTPNDQSTIDYIHKCASSRISALKDMEFKVNAGYRPCTPNSLPLVGGLNYDNLYLNSGHGMFGWTLGAACASSIADIMES